MTEPEPGGTALAEALHRAADALPPPALPGDLWTRGRRERRRRVVRRAGAVVAAVVAAALGLPALGVVAPPVVGPAGSKVSGYPMRINHQWVVRDLPARPGPLAAVVEVRGKDNLPSWQAVAPDGHLWRIPILKNDDTYPALSDDGRYLAYLDDRSRRLVIRDLVGGRVQRFGDVGENRVDLDPVAAYRMSAQQPGRFSPDSSKLLFAGQDFVIDRMGGRVLPLDRSETTGLAIGWDGNDALWRVTSTDRDTTDSTVDAATVFSVPLNGGAPRRHPLPSTEPLSADWFSQWAGPMSPDGRRLALIPALSEEQGAVFDLSGSLTPLVTDGRSVLCPSAWKGDQLVFPAYQPDLQPHHDGDHGVVATTLLDPPAAPATLSVTSLRIRATCVIWAADALAAGPTGWHPFGTSTARWTWYWPELTATALAAVLAAAALVIRRRTRRSRIS